MIVTRYNFETNSSSMHSLSFRRESGPYTAADLQRTEAMENMTYHDAIIMLKDGHTVTEEEIRKDCWIYDNRMGIWDHSMELAGSAMEVMSTFRDKLTYALATAYGYRYKGWEKRVEEIKAVFAKVLPYVELSLDIERYRWCNSNSVGTNQYLLYPFLKMNNITIEEFLTNTKYIVIVNYAEYEKMRWLNMVDESQIVEVYHPHENDDYTMKIVDGVWKLSSCDIQFGRYPFRVLGTPEGKARYALACHHSTNIDEVLSIMQEVYPEMKSIELPRDKWYDGGVNHGYTDDGGVIPDNIPLRDFILDKKYVVISDGDEYCIWSGFKKTPLFNREEYCEEHIDDDY